VDAGADAVCLAGRFPAFLPDGVRYAILSSDLSLLRSAATAVAGDVG